MCQCRLVTRTVHRHEGKTSQPSPSVGLSQLDRRARRLASTAHMPGSRTCMEPPLLRWRPDRTGASSRFAQRSGPLRNSSRATRAVAEATPFSATMTAQAAKAAKTTLGRRWAASAARGSVGKVRDRVGASSVRRRQARALRSSASPRCLATSLIDFQAEECRRGATARSPRSRAPGPTPCGLPHCRF